jgi:hypothetical protein
VSRDYSTMVSKRLKLPNKSETPVMSRSVH